MVLPLWIILIPYGLYLVLSGALAFVNVYHMVRFGTFGMVNFFALFCFLASAALILWTTAFLLAGINWPQAFGTTGGIGVFTTPPDL